MHIKVCWSSKWVPKTYYNNYEKKQLCQSYIGPKKAGKRLDFGKTSYKDLVFAPCEFLRFFGAPNESLRLIVIYYMFKKTFGNKTTLVESYRSQKSPLKAPFRQNKLCWLSFCARIIFRVCWRSKWVPKTYYNNFRKKQLCQS